MQAAILRVKLERLEQDNQMRKKAASQYCSGISNKALSLPIIAENMSHVFHQFVIRTKRRESLRDHLTSKGVGTLIHYPLPIHLQPAYQGNVVISPSGLDVTEKVANEVLSLPMYPQISEDQIQVVIEAIESWNI
jgi:dTDP-4-amino-4,6-dideoxygalactose transaminase